MLLFTFFSIFVNHSQIALSINGFALHFNQFVGIMYYVYLKQVLRIFSCFSVKTVLTFPALLLRSLSDAFFRSSSYSPDPNVFS